jgi:hypothetical protein
LIAARTFADDIEFCIPALTSYANYWTERLVAAKLPWNAANKASFAYSLVLKEMVNLNLSEVQSCALFDEITLLYAEEGICGSIPRPSVMA